MKARKKVEKNRYLLQKKLEHDQRSAFSCAVFFFFFLITSICENMDVVQISSACVCVCRVG